MQNEAARGSANRVCPYLGIANDPATITTYGTPLHRCYSASRPQPLDLAYQERYCLGDYTVCALYVAARRGSAAPAAMLPPKPRAGLRPWMLLPAVGAIIGMLLLAQGLRMIVGQAAATGIGPMPTATATAPEPRQVTSTIALAAAPTVGVAVTRTATPGEPAVTVSPAFVAVTVVPTGTTVSSPTPLVTATPPTTATVASPTSCATATATARTGPLTYTVQPGDSISSIADRFGITEAALLKVNKLTSRDYIQAGQKLNIP